MIAAPVVARPPRAVAIDYFKSYLVIGMVFAHTSALLYSDNNGLIGKSMHALVTAINLVSFPGFFFCFGYVNYQVYLTRTGPEVRSKLFKNALRILAAYYISAFASAILLSDFKFEIGRFIRILVFTEMPAYSEFLLAFFLVTILTGLLFSYIKKVVGTKLTFYTLIAISLLSALLIPYQRILSNQAGLFIGGRNFIGFPMLQYLCYFLIGILFAVKGLKAGIKILLSSLLISLPFLFTVIITGHLPNRFPPDITWITGSAFLLSLYHSISLRSESWFGRDNWFLSIGRQTLLYLIMSNLILFALVARFGTNSLMNPGIISVIYLSTISVIYYLSRQVAR